MPVGYGSNFELPKLTSVEIGVVISTASNGGEGTYNLLTIIGEVIASIFQPELTPLFALAGASARLGIEAGYGEKISPVGTAIDFGGAIIPGIGSGISNVLSLGKLSAGIDSAFIDLAGQGIDPLSTTFGNVLQAGTETASGGGSIFRNSFNTFQKNLVGQFPGGGVIQEGLKTAAQEFAPSIASQLAKTGVNTAAELAGGTTEDLVSSAREAGLSEEFIEELLQYQLEGYSYRSIRSIFIDELQRQLGSREALRIIRELPEAKDIIGRLQKLELDREQRKGFTGKLNYALRHPVKFASSSEGNAALQWIQNIFDGNDLGRFLIEKPYSMIKEQIDKFFKDLKPIIKDAEKVEDAWVKTGGTLVNSSVILGYKVIKESKIPDGENLVLIKFYNEPTKGKKPVFVRARDIQLAELVEGGMGYYLKKWAVNRGGRGGVNNSFLKVPPQLKFLLRQTTSFLPISAIRWFESMASNITGSFLQHSSKDGFSFKWTGIGSDAYNAKIGKTVGHTFANRVDRMFTRVIAGGFAKYRLGSRNPIAKYIGSELQRFGGAGVNTVFDITGMTGRSRLSAGDIARRNFGKASLQGVKGSATYINRRLLSRNNGGSNYIRQVVGTRRNLGILQRPASSLSGGGFGFTSLGKFKI